MLHTTPEHIIITDLSEKKGYFFPEVKNENLKMVIHEGKTYAIQVSAGEVEKLVEASEEFKRY